ncbi:MAG: hypothetical protein AB7F86_04000 [Bdellovibrionales bacterium]
MRSIEESPTDTEITDVKNEIRLLSRREASLLPPLREVFHAQVKSAEEQLRLVCADLDNSRAKDSSSTLKKLVKKRWGKLSATVMMAEAYSS